LGSQRVVINTHHLAHTFRWIINNLGVNSEIFHEHELLGTAGAISAARAALKPAPALVWNGDILTRPPVAELLAAAEQSTGLCLAVSLTDAGSGTLGLDRNGNVVRLRGERFGEEVSGGDYIGVAGIGAGCLEGLPRSGCLIADWALPELRRGGIIPTVTTREPWTAVGDIRAYLLANREWLELHANSEHGSWVAADARVRHSVKISESVIGAGARVFGRGWVERSVVWPGAQAEAPLVDAVVLRSGRVVRLG
ncbi:MAG TPA: NDP-sugar synthase, partial [Polyangiaceae bacterium]